MWRSRWDEVAYYVVLCRKCGRRRAIREGQATYTCPYCKHRNRFGRNVVVYYTTSWEVAQRVCAKANEQAK